MDYYKLDIKSLFSAIFIWSIFLSDFGIVLAGQSIYFFQMLAFFFLISYLAQKPQIEKGWAVFFALTIITIFINSSILYEGRQFAGDTYPWTSIKAFINIVLFYAVYKTTIYSYHKINPNLFLYLSIFMILYGLLEWLFASNSSVKQILSLLHTNPKALEKESLSLLGREHSYGALGYMITACILIYFYLRKTFTGFKSLLVIPCILSLVFFVVLAKSKSVYLGILFFAFLFLVLVVNQRKLTFSSIFIICLTAIGLGTVTLVVIQNGFFLDAFESVSGDIGSGSTFIRFVNLQVAWAIALDNPLWGVGPGNYKLFYVEYIHLLNIPIILDLVVLTDPSYKLGSIDPTNFFAGIFSEYGFISFTIIFYIIFKRVLTLLPRRNVNLKKVPLALLLSPIIFGAALGFYYWAVSFFPFFLAVLHIEYKKYKYNEK